MSASCPACARDVDPLRAGHVAIFGERFYYFCDRSCRDRLAPARRVEALLARGSFPASSREVAERASSDLGAEVGASAYGTNSDSVAASDPIAEPAPSSSRSSERLRAGDVYRVEASSDLRAALVWVAVAAGLLAISIVLAGTTPFVIALRDGMALFGWAVLVARAARGRREPTDVHPAFLLAPGLSACIVAAAAWVLGDPAAEETATFAGIVVTGTALAISFVERARHVSASERTRIAEVLASLKQDGHPQPGLVLRQEIRPGEEMAVSAGDVLSVDGSIVAGSAVVVPWLFATESTKRREGDALLAGAKVITGSIRVRATYTGFDRAFARLTLDPRRRADVHARVARVARAVATRGGVVAMLLAGLAAIANGETGFRIALSAIAAYASITTAAVGSMAAVHVGRGVLEGLRRGVSFRGPGDWDRAGDVSIAAFCARGTLLLGEPELADLEAVGKVSEEHVLALAAGAESSNSHPVAMAVQRAASARRVRPDAVRSPIVQVGLGVSAVASTGEALIVGSRALMLKEKISVAIAEQVIAEIEAHGREVLLVAVAGKLVGVIGLQDGVRPGARAAVQHLLDAQIEPVLLSGDSRETCEAIGRALDIDHIRPEIPSADRAHEVERLAQGGVTVAVLGHPRTDEAALSAANVAVAMPALGKTPGEWGVMLASDDVRDGALAISLSRRTKHEARTALVLALSPGVFSALAVAFGLLPAAYAPVAALFGAVASAFHARATDLTRPAASSSAQRPSFG